MVKKSNNDDSEDLAGLEKVLHARRAMIKQKEEEKPPPPPPVSLGPVGAIVDALINTSPEKLLELTDLDRNQVTLIPQVVVIDDMWDYLEHVTLYRSDNNMYAEAFKKKLPDTPDTTGKYITLLAQCRRSLGGKTQKALEDLALADLEARANEEEMGGFGGHEFED